jgi:hypothetical protein
LEDVAWLSTPEAAARLGLAPQTLEKLRVIGGGPRFGKFGRAVRYAPGALEEWAAQRVRASTSDIGGPGS